MHVLNDWLLAGIPLGSWLNALIVATLAYLVMDLVTRFVTRRLTALSTRTRGRSALAHQTLAAVPAGHRDWTRYTDLA